jgi:hypothetical protein
VKWPSPGLSANSVTFWFYMDTDRFREPSTKIP